MSFLLYFLTGIFVFHVALACEKSGDKVEKCGVANGVIPAEGKNSTEVFWRKDLCMYSSIFAESCPCVEDYQIELAKLWCGNAAHSYAEYEKSEQFPEIEDCDNKDGEEGEEGKEKKGGKKQDSKSKTGKKQKRSNDDCE
ncbi:unnamed protein product, partial [Mesorhabditis spiculigera]